MTMSKWVATSLPPRSSTRTAGIQKVSSRSGDQPISGSSTKRPVPMSTMVIIIFDVIGRTRTSPPLGSSNILRQYPAMRS